MPGDVAQMQGGDVATWSRGLRSACAARVGLVGHDAASSRACSSTSSACLVLSTNAPLLSVVLLHASSSTVACLTCCVEPGLMVQRTFLASLDMARLDVDLGAAGLLGVIRGQPRDGPHCLELLPLALDHTPASVGASALCTDWLIGMGEHGNVDLQLDHTLGGILGGSRRMAVRGLDGGVGRADAGLGAWGRGSLDGDGALFVVGEGRGLGWVGVGMGSSDLDGLGDAVVGVGPAGRHGHLDLDAHLALAGGLGGVVGLVDVGALGDLGACGWGRPAGGSGARLGLGRGDLGVVDAVPARLRGGLANLGGDVGALLGQGPAGGGMGAGRRDGQGAAAAAGCLGASICGLRGSDLGIWGCVLASTEECGGLELGVGGRTGVAGQLQCGLEVGGGQVRVDVEGRGRDAGGARAYNCGSAARVLMHPRRPGPGATAADQLLLGAIVAASTAPAQPHVLPNADVCISFTCMA